MIESAVNAVCLRLGAVLERLSPPSPCGRRIAHLQHRGRLYAIPFRSLEELETQIRKKGTRP